MHLRVVEYISITIICLSIFVNADNANKNDTTAKLEYATSIAKMVQLLDMEKELMQNLNQYADLMEDKITKIQLLVGTLNREKDRSKTDPESHLSNPLNSFALIRRLQSDWRKWHEYAKQPVGQDKIDFVEGLRLKMPTKEDFKEATIGIHRLQLSYFLKTKDLAAGRIGSKQFDIKVSPLDCFAMGEHLSTLKLHSHALEWFEQARELFLPNYTKMYQILGVDLADIWHMIADQLTDMKKYLEATDAINKALSYRPNDLKLKVFQEDLDHFLIHERLCRANRQPTSKLLHCRYNHTTSPFLRIAPMKLEEMSLHPYIALYHDFITDKEIKELREYSIPYMRRARVSSGEISPERTARQADFYGNETDLFKILNLRFADISGLSLEYSTALSVMNYGLGGHHYNHADYYNETARFTELGGNRLLLIVVFLRDVEMGGALAFAKLNFAVPSIKGAAVAFNLLDNAGDNDERSLHASCPVAYGSKWSLLKVFNERAQVFRRPCCYNLL